VLTFGNGEALPERTLPLSRAQPPEGEAVPTVQQLFSFARPLAARVRSVRRPFRPSQGRGPYRLPHDIADRLRESLAPFRNRDAAYVLAVFLARYWSTPGRISGSFPIDRRALADHAELGLTEKRVRSAIRTLEAVGFLDRAIPAPGSLYKATADGLHRKPVLFVFGSDYAPAFLAANRRTAARRSAAAKGPKDRIQASATVLMGPLREEIGIPPTPSVPDSPLEAALDRLRRAAEGQGLFRTAARRDSET
jgi:hypothetical protein